MQTLTADEPFWDAIADKYAKKPVDDPAAFVMMAGHLRGLGLSAPEVLAQDIR